jgi:hypothetical protein
MNPHNRSREQTARTADEDHLPYGAAEPKCSSSNCDAGQGPDEDGLPSKIVGRLAPSDHHTHLNEGEQRFLERSIKTINSIGQSHDEPAVEPNVGLSDFASVKYHLIDEGKNAEEGHRLDEARKTEEKYLDFG